MKSFSSNFDYFYEDENGDNPLKIVGEISFEGEYYFTPEEPMVMYYPDGSGYPGSPAEIETYNFIATKIDDLVLTAEQGKIVGDWLDNLFHQNSELNNYLEEHIGEKINILFEPPDYDDYDD